MSADQCMYCARLEVNIQHARRDLERIARKAARTGDPSKIAGAKGYLADQIQYRSAHLESNHGEAA